MIINESKIINEDLADQISDLLTKNKINHSIGKKRNRIQVQRSDLIKASELARTIDKDSKVSICSLI